MVMQYDVIVIGGGHAGTEAALASARLKANTLLLTHNLDTLGQMSCNPAVGGIGKGHLVKEVDALGGAIALATDKAGIQFRILNRSKGPAVRATRAQADRVLYRQAIREILQNQPNLTLFQQSVAHLLIEGERVVGVVTEMGMVIHARAVVVTTGTFLGGKIHVGQDQYAGGRAGDPPANALATSLRDLGLPVGRLKTGTPPRIDGRSLNYDAMEIQPGDTPVPVFSYMGHASMHPEQVPCYITHTTETTQAIILDNLHRSAMYSGAIEGVGPRYCPSIEDKMVRFADKKTHQIFVEPEGLTTNEIYPNGISTSLPFDVQVAFVRSIRGFENAHITRPGYAIEYDYYDPRGLTSFLQTKPIPNLFFAGQINGTTGYEEAAAQGIIAGMNAGLWVQEKDLWSPHRSEAYIGVLIDDLITQGTIEPYRMFTSRAEYRLLLREDNADVRLTEIGQHLGLIEDDRWRAYSEKREALGRVRDALASTWIHTEHNALLDGVLQAPLQQSTRASDLLKRPEMSYALLSTIADFGLPLVDEAVSEQITIENTYEGYIARQMEDVDRLKKQERLALPTDFDYQQIKGLSNEVVQKLNRIKPTTLGQAARIGGVTPAALSLVTIYLKKYRMQQDA